MNKPFFNKDITNIIKGISIIMMYIHHFFMFPSWWVEGISYPNIDKFIPFFRDPLRLCVAIFCFLTGYTYYFNNNKNFKYSLKKITDILISYWSVFFIFAIIAVNNGYKYSSKVFIKELFAAERPTMIFCWYIYFYIAFMLVLPFITKRMSKNIYTDILFSVFFVPVFAFLVEYLLRRFNILRALCSYFRDWFPTILIGFIFAKYHLFEKIERFENKKIPSKFARLIIWICLFLFVPFGRLFPKCLTTFFDSFPAFQQMLCMLSFDFIYAPVFIYSVIKLCNTTKSAFINKFLKQIGKYSLLMWFVSCIFFNNSKAIFQPILYLPRNPIFVLIWGLFICLTVSVMLDYFLSNVIKWKNKLLKL